MATLKASREGLWGRELQVAAGRLETESKQTLRAIGMSNEEIEADFPMDIVINGVQMINHNPDEFNRQCAEATAWLQSRN
jgi:hypothetical protein